VMGVDVLHVEKQGNNVRLLGSARLEPEAAMIDEYAQIRGALWNPLFRRQRLLNLIGGREWHAGFDRLLSTQPYEQTIGNNYFRHDARESFSNEVETMTEQLHASAEGSETNGDGSAESLSLETLVYRAVNNYLRFKLDSKYGLGWKAVQGKPQEESDYREKKAKLARDAFLAVRSRTGQDFVEYFVSTLCSVSQSMGEDRFIALTQALVRDTDNVRTLTMLALAAQTPSPQKTAPQN
jgi:CRISPR-associated protein Cmx8